MRIIAIDPGFERVGVAIIEKLENNKPEKEELIYSDCFKTSVNLPLSERIALIGTEIKRLLKKYGPAALAIETLYFNKNKKTAMAVSEARGVIIYECTLSGLPVFEYTPLQVKVAVTSYGKATKPQVISMIKKLIRIDDSITSDDEIDAIAIGLTYFAHVKP